MNYYYEQLSKEQQKAYYAMKEGLLNLQDSIAVPKLSTKERWSKVGKKMLSWIG